MFYLCCAQMSYFVFGEFLETYSKILTSNGVENIITTTVLQNDDMWLFCHNNLTELPKKGILYNFENNDNLQEIFNKNTNLSIIEYSCEKNIQKWKDIGYKKVYYLPYGYSIHNEPTINFENINKDIDILFYGYITPRRNTIISRICSFCNNEGYNIVIRNNNLFDKNEKINLIHRSKIIITINSYSRMSSGHNDLTRLSFVIMNRGFILAEKSTGDIEKDLDINFIDEAEFENKIKYFLQDQAEQERNINTEKVYEQFKLNYNLDEKLPKIINDILTT